MESIETRIIVTTHNPKKADKFRTKKEKQGFKYVMEFSKLEQFK